MFTGPIKFLASDTLDVETIPLVRKFGGRFLTLAPGTGGKRIIREAVVSASKAIAPPYITTVIAAPPPPVLLALAPAFYNAGDFGNPLYPLCPVTIAYNRNRFPQARMRVAPKDDGDDEDGQGPVGWNRSPGAVFDECGVFSAGDMEGVFSFRPVGDSKTRYEFGMITDTHFGVWDRGALAASAYNVFPDEDADEIPPASRTGIGVNITYMSGDVEPDLFDFSMPKKQNSPRVFGVNISPEDFESAFDGAKWATTAFLHKSYAAAFYHNDGKKLEFGSMRGDCALYTGAFGDVAAFIHIMRGKNNKKNSAALVVATPLAWGDVEKTMEVFFDIIKDRYTNVEPPPEGMVWRRTYEPPETTTEFFNPDGTELKDYSASTPSILIDNMAGVGVGVWSLFVGEEGKLSKQASTVKKTTLVDVSITRGSDLTDTIGELYETSYYFEAKNLTSEDWEDTPWPDDPSEACQLVLSRGEKRGNIISPPVHVYGVACASFQERYSDGFSDSSFVTAFHIQHNEVPEEYKNDGECVRLALASGRGGEERAYAFLKTGKVSATKGTIDGESTRLFGKEEFIPIVRRKDEDGNLIPDVTPEDYKGRKIIFCNSGTDLLIVSDVSTKVGLDPEHDPEGNFYLVQVDHEKTKTYAVFPESLSDIELNTTHDAAPVLAAKAFLEPGLYYKAKEKGVDAVLPRHQQKVAVRAGTDGAIYVLTAEVDSDSPEEMVLYVEIVGGEQSVVYTVPMEHFPPSANKIWMAGAYQLTELLHAYPRPEEDGAFPPVLLLTYNGVSTDGTVWPNQYPRDAFGVRRLISSDNGKTWERFIDDGFSPMYYMGNRFWSVSRSPLKKRSS